MTPATLDRSSLEAERARCATLLRDEARCERNRAASYRSKKNHPELDPLRREFMSFIAEDVARALDEIAVKVERGDAPATFAKDAQP